jgi:carboxypeptidase family protein
MKWSSVKFVCLLWFVACFILVGTARSQNVGSLSGTVSDPSGAAVAGAKVTITDQGSGLTRTVESDKNGEYNFAQLNPGTYRLEVVKDRFKTSITEKVSVLVATPTQFTVKLELGAMSEQVVVESAAPALNTQDATVGNAIGEQDIKSLPFLARNVVNLLTLQPGVVFTGMSDTDRLSMGSVSTLDAREGSVNGMRGNQTNITVDGVDANDWQNQAAFTSALPVTLDSVQEFRVTTTNANATNGLSGGAQVQLVTKNGSNEFHGNARWYYRTVGTSANTFFNNAISPAVERGKDQRNIGGGSVGGPIIKDRLFFFLDNEERREAVAAGASRIVPSDSLRDGVLIYQCAAATDCPTATTVNGLTAAHTVPSGFHGLSPSDLKALDPASLGINTAMVPYMALFPHGNDPTQGLDAGTVDLSGNAAVANFIGLRFNAPVLTFNNVYIARFDYNITKDGRHTIFWRGSMQGLKTDVTEAQFPGQSAASQLLNNSRGYAVQYQGQLSPNWINTARYGFTRLGVNQSGVTGPLFDVRSFTDVLNFGARPVGRTVPVHEINDDVSWIRGKHAFQFGGVARFITNNRIDQANSFPAFSINNGFCVGLCEDVPRCLGNAACVAGRSFPSAANQDAVTRAFMMLSGSITQVNATYFGNPSTGAISPAGTPDVRHFAERSMEGYFQDSWRLRPNLVFTYGLRYGYETPVWETKGLEVRPSFDIMQWFRDRMVNMNKGIPSDASPLLSWVPAGKANKGANSWYDPYLKDFGPRLSLAYSPGYQGGLLGSLFGGPGKSSIRLGAGITYDNIGQVIALDSDSQGSPGTSTAEINDSQQFTLATAPRFSGSCTATGCTGLPPAGPPFFNPPTSATFPFTPAPVVALTGFAVDPHLRTPYAIHLTVSIQRQLPKNVVLDVTYVGTLGRRLLGKMDYGQFLDIRDPKSGVDMWSAQRQIARLAGITPQGGGPTVAPNILNSDGSFNTQLLTIKDIPFFNDMLPNMPAFGASVDCGAPGANNPNFAACQSGYNSLTPTQAFYAYTINNFGPSWGCALFPIDTKPSHASKAGGTIPSPWNATVDPQRNGRVLFQEQFQTLPGWSNEANSNYHSLQISVRKTVGIATLGGNYVFSKSLDNSSSGENADIAAGGGTLSGVIQNPFNLRDGRALSDFDLKHNFNGYWVVDLPFGKGRKFLGNANRLTDAALGGWELTGAARWHSGFPFGPGNGFNFPTNFFLTSSGTWTGSVKTSLVRNGAFGVPNIFKDANAAFNNVGFTLPGLAGSRNIMRGPAYASADMGVYKTFKMPWSEKQRLQFRVSAYNIFNSVNFADSSLSIDPTSPGTFGNLTSTAGPTTGSLGARDMEFAVRFEF